MLLELTNLKTQTDAIPPPEERAPSRSQALQASIVHSSSDAIIGKTLGGIITTWNRGAENIYGYSAEEIVGKPIALLAEAEQRDEMAEILTIIRNGEAVEQFETTRVRKDGKVVSVSLTVSPIHDSTGRLVGASTIARNITKRKQAEEKALATSQYGRSLIEASLDPFVMISPEGKITDVNEGSIKVTGVPREELIGTDFCEYFTEPAKAREGYQQVFAVGSVTNFPLTIRHRNRQLAEVLYNASVYRDAGGKVLGVFAAARDITAQKKAEAVIAEQRNKELERMAELERFQKLTVGRELKMIELKKEIERLKTRLPQGDD